MEGLSSANRSEIQHDLSTDLNYIASYTQVEKLQRDVDWLKHMIFNGIAKKENASSVETLIKKYEDGIKRLTGYGYEVYMREHQKNLPDMYAGLDQLKDAN